MNLEALKAKLDEAEFTQLTEHVTALTNQRDEARAESITGRKSLKAEVEDLRGLKAKLFDRLGIESADEIDALPDAKGQADAAKQFETKLKRMATELETTKGAYTTLEGKHRGTLLEAQLQKALAGHEFVDRDLVGEFVKARVKFEDDSFVYAEGDKVISLEEGVKLLASTKPHLLKAQGTGGSGFNPTSTSGKVKAFNEMSLTERTDLYKTNRPLYDQLQSGSKAA